MNSTKVLVAIVILLLLVTVTIFVKILDKEEPVIEEETQVNKPQSTMQERRNALKDAFK